MDSADLEYLALLEEQDRRRAQESFLAYYMRMTAFQPEPHHKIICRLLQSMEEDKVDRGMVFLPPRMAKALDVNTPIPTPHGMVAMGDLRTGGQVYHPSGQPTRVTGTSGVFNGNRCFEVRLSDGSSVIADANHLWETRLCRKHDIWKAKTTLQLFDRQEGNPKARSPRLPKQSAAKMPQRDLPIPPYILGVWLGDGYSAGGRISSHADDIPHYVEAIQAEGFMVSCVRHNRFTIRGLQARLRALGLLGDKRIPQEYLFASEDQRRALLRGLMDTDGTISDNPRTAGYCTFANTNLELIRGVQQLLWSLGIKNTLNEAVAMLNGKDCGPSFKVHFLDEDCCSLPRKRERLRSKITQRDRHIRSIVEVESRPTRCISVAASDGLFLAGEGFIPTHNSTLCTQLFPSWIIGRHPRDFIMSGVHTQKFADKMGKIVRNYLRSPLYPFEAELAGDSQAKSQWATAQGGEYNGFGLMGGSTHGNPASWLLMDDLIKGRKMAQSAHMRDEAWDTYKADLLTRLQGRRKQLLVTCLVADTKVSMADGTLRRICDVVPGEKVRAWEGGRPVNRTVKAMIPQGEDETFTLRTNNSKITGNARHPFLLDRGNGPEWVRLSEIKPGDMIVTSAVTNGRSKARLTLKEAWLLGFMFGDGWVTVRDTVQKGRGQYVAKDGTKRVYAENTYPRRGYVTCAAIGANEAENETVEGLFEELFGAKMKRTKFGYLRTDRANVGRWMTEHGLTGTAKTKRVPEWMFRQPLAVRQAFLMGYGEADGHYDQNHRCSFVSCNLPLIEDMRHLARSTGFTVSNITSSIGKSTPLNSPEEIEWERHSFGISQGRITSPFHLSRVREVVPAGRQEVFDLTVDGAECFLADGMVSHNTRWHEDDPAGRILPENFDGRTGWYRDRETGEKWFVLSIPAMAEHENDPVGRKPGEWLWESQWGDKAWGGIKKRGGYIWSALYQQRPSPAEGLMFQDEHIRRYSPGRVDLTQMQVYGASDYAVSTEAGSPDPDYTVHMIWGVDPDWNIYLLDMWRGRATSDVWIREWIRLVKKWKPLRWGEEQGQIIKSVGPFLANMASVERAFTDRVQLTSTTSKEMRAQSLLGMASMGKMYLPKRDEIPAYFLNHLDAFEKELKQFPTGRHDDTVDTATLFARLLDRIVEGKKPSSKGVSPHGETLGELFSRHEQDNDRDDW